MPKLLITQATGYRFRGLLEPYKLRKRKLVGAVIPYLAALAPKEWEVTLVDDATEQIDFHADVDVVAITIGTVTSLRGYEIAEKFRRRGIPVLMGGPHATFYADEVAEHADAVCIGEAEEVFPKMLEDAAAGRLQKFYRRDTVASLAGMPAPRWDLLDPTKYVFYRPYVIQYSRGCPYVRLLRRAQIEWRLWLSLPAGGRGGGGRETLREQTHLLRGQPVCRQRGSRHGVDGSADPAENPLVHAVLRPLLPGREVYGPGGSLGPAARQHRRREHQSANAGDHAQELQQILGIRPHDQEPDQRNISYSLNFVSGSDADDDTVFDATLRLLHEYKAQTAYFNILVPLRGTAMHQKFKEEGRLLDEANMERWPGLSCHFKPLHFTPDELVRRIMKIRRDFYTTGSAIRRLPVPYRQAHFASWNLHFLQRKVVAHMDSMRDFTEF